MKKKLLLTSFLVFFLNSFSQDLSIEINNVKNNTLCSEFSDGEVLFTSSGGTPPYHYNLIEDFNGTVILNSLEPIFSGLSPSFYTIQVTDSNNETTTASFTIEDTIPLEITATTIIRDFSCYDNHGEIRVTSTGGTPPYSYALNGGPFQSNEIFTNLSAGTHSISVQDANGCNNTLEITIEEMPSLIINASINNNVNCNEIDNGEITVTSTGGLPPYSYALNGGPFQSNEIFTNLSAGTHSISVQDANGCSNLTEVIIDAISPLSIITTSNDVSCNGLSDGILNISVTGGIPPYSYSLNGNTFQSSDIFTNLIAGTYSIEVQDANNCAYSIITTVNEPTSITATATTTENTITLTVSGGNIPYQYSIDNGTSFQSSPVFTNLTSGNYNPIVRDAYGCSETLSNTIIENKPPLDVFVYVVNPILCNDSDLTAVDFEIKNGTPPYHYHVTNLITNHTISSVSNYHYFSIPDLTFGDYIVDITDGNNETITYSFIIEESIPLEINATIIQNISCYGGLNDGEIRVTSTGGTPPYSYALNGGSFQSNEIFTNISAGTYSISVQDANGCSNLTEVIIDAISPLSVITTSNEVSCNGLSDGAINISATGGIPPYSYSLNGNTFQSNDTFTNLIAGRYSIEVQDANNCAYSIITTVNEPTSITGTVTTTENTITLTVNGGNIPYQYSIDNGTNFQSSPVFTNLTSGNYNPIVRDAHGCLVTLANTVIENKPPLDVYTNIVNPILCSGFNLADVQVEVINGTPPFNYEILANYSNTAVISYSSTNSFFFIPSLNAGVYDLTITDSNNKTITSTFTIEDVIPLDITATIIRGASCFENDGEIRVTSTGGTPPYSYALNGGPFQSNEIFTNLSAGTHSISVQDANGCSSLTEVIIDIPSPLNITTVSNDVSCHENDGEIRVTSTGGTPPYSYALNGGPFQSNEIFTNLSAGTHSISVQDANGCSNLTEVIIDIPSPLNVTTISNDVSCNGLSDGILNISVTGGIPPYSYSLNGNTFQSSDIFTNLTVGTYSIEVQDANGCINSTTTTVNEPDVLIISSIDIIPSGNEPSGIISIEATGGTAPYSYSINGNSFLSSNNFSGLASGTYTLIAQDSNRCNSLNFTITINQLDIDNSITQESNELEATYKNAVSYQWINADTKTRISEAVTSTFKPSESGRYQVEMTLTESATRTVIQNRTVSQIVLSPIIEFNINATLSSEDIKKNNFSIYPNPTVNFINVPSNLLDEGYKIYTILGTEVSNGKIESSRINVESLSQGIYFLKVKQYSPLKFIKK